MKANTQMRIEYEPLSAIVQWPRNPKLHQLDEIGKSVDRFGYVSPITVDETTKQLVAGHGRLAVLQQMKAEGKNPPARIEVAKDGEWMVPVIRGIAFASQAEAESYLLADNRLSEIGGWDDTMLTKILEDLSASGTTNLLEGIGWTHDQVEELLRVQIDPLATSPTPGQLAAAYAEGEIKQVVLYFNPDEYEEIVGKKLAKIMEVNSIATHTDAVVFLVREYEAERLRQGHGKL
jgi:hypothetical protein